MKRRPERAGGRFGPLGLMALGWVVAGLAISPVAAQTKKRVSATDGKAIYLRECKVCHGPDGRGDGPASYYLFPKPRSLADGLFKIRSTPSGEPPTDSDLFRTLSRGLPGSAMPGFVWLTEAERWALVTYVKELANIREKPEEVVVPPPKPPSDPKILSLGRKTYDKLECAECHGVEGRGDGTSAPTLKDDRGFPIPPNDFTRGLYKGGGSDKDVYMRFMTGLDGTPMPSYEGTLSEKEAWGLVYYVRSLAGKKVAVQPSTGDIETRRVPGDLPSNPMDPLWSKVPATRIPLMLLWQRRRASEGVTVRAVHNGRRLALLLEWEDLKPDARLIRNQDYSDGAAVQFSLSAKPPPFPMGDKGRPVNIWYWRADRQMDLARFRDVEDVYSRLVADDYQSDISRYPRGHLDVPQHLRPLQILSAPAHNPTFLSGWAAGNPVSYPWRFSPIEDLNAEGFGTLTPQEEKGQNIRGVGFWVAGAWKVVFERDLASKDPFDVKLKPGGSVPVAFAVWDGSQQDRDGQKAVTTWYTLRLKQR
ncbi:MAG: ethylbenzene dehydrogenase-related protein [Nitrospinota bacterium]